MSVAIKRETAVLVDVGEMIHVVERRRFDTDLRRHFFGVAERVELNAMRVRGYVFLYDSGTTTYLRSAEQRTRVISLTGDGLIINLAPPGTNIEDVRYEDQEGRLVVTDGGAFRLDINEFGRNR